jgi:hypothetical protein
VSIHARFGPLKQRYNMLEYFEVRVKEDELAGLQSMPQLYEQLQTARSVCEKRAVDSKRVMKKELERNVVGFDKDLDMLNSDMKNRAHSAMSVPACRQRPAFLNPPPHHDFFM